jgi:acetate kinase
MNILVINSGSTSVKFKLFKRPDLNLVKQGEVENVTSCEVALRQVLRQIGDVSQVQAVGHRVVHGGREFYETIEISGEILKRLERYNDLAPLHNPHNIAGIKAMKEYLPHSRNFAVFDTAFFKDLPLRAQLYALPRNFWEKYQIQRYGFHGISHEYAGREACLKLQRPFDRTKLITIHLGGGSSLTAIDGGKAVDTTMGFTPLEGPMMLTRAGDLDPGLVLKLIKEGPEEKEKAVAEVSELLNEKSGIKGLTGCSDFLELLKLSQTREEARLAFEIYIYRLKKYIGAYFAILGDVHALVFTGKIGAGKAITRHKILEDMDFLKKVPVVVVEPNEELLIAQKVRDKIF